MPLALQGWCFVSPKGKSPAQHYGSLSLISSQIQDLCCHSGHVCLGHTFRKATEKKVKIMCYINVEGAVCSPGNPTSSTGPRCKWGGHRENHKEAQLLVIKHGDSKFTLFSLGNSWAAGCQRLDGILGEWPMCCMAIFLLPFPLSACWLLETQADVHLRRAILLLLNSEGHSTGEAQNRLQSWNLHNQEVSPWWLQSPAFCVMLLVGEWVFGAVSTGHCSEFFRGELVLLHMGTEA